MLPIMQTDSWFPYVFNSFFNSDAHSQVSVTTPALNILEREKEYTVEMAVPGMKKGDFIVSIDADGNLNIKMEKQGQEETKQADGRYLRREFSYGKFDRTLILPDEVEKENISAKVEDGILYITLPKVDTTKATVQRTIEIG